MSWFRRVLSLQNEMYSTAAAVEPAAREGDTEAAGVALSDTPPLLREIGKGAYAACHVA